MKSVARWPWDASLIEMVHSYCACERWGCLTKTFFMLIYIETNQRASHLLLNSNWLLCKRSIYLYEGCRVAWSIASKWRALVPFILVIPTTRPPTKIKKCNIYKCMNIYIIIYHYEYIYYKRNILPLPQNISHIMIIFKRSKMKQVDKFWNELISWWVWNTWDHRWAKFRVIFTCLFHCFLFQITLQT